MNNRKAPRIRFKGFTDDWEQRKVSEIFKITRGYVLAATETADIKDDKNCYPVYSSQTKNEGLMGFYSEYLYENAITWTTDGANAGTVRYRSGKFYCTNVCGVLLSEEGYANKAVSEALNSVAWKYVSHVGNPKLMNNVMADIEIVIPKLVKEQETISRYFDEIDHLITLHQRKLEKLKIVKKAMLENCFPKNGEKVPKFRFSGFSGDWEQRKLIDYLEVSKDKNKEEAFGKEDVLSVSGDYGIVNQIEFQGRSFAGASVALYGIVDTGNIVYTKSPLKSNPFGIIKANKGKPGIVSTLYAVYKPLDNVCSEFVQVYFEQDVRMNNYMHPLVNKGAKNDMKVTDENALRGDVCFPDKAEQIKMSEHFAKLDHLITLHQRK